MASRKEPQQALTKEELKAEYDARRSLYERLAVNIQQALKTFLSDHHIPHLDISYRVKDFDSAFAKVGRKGYNQPLTQMEDWCGLRVICYYPSDVKRICEIVEKEFEVREEEDKAKRLGNHEFGYRSTHFIVEVNKAWTQAPNFRGLGGLKAEIQVRTILMHAWAEIEHKLAYKSSEQVPDKFRRSLFRLSAKFEEADEQFDDLRAGLSEYRNQIRASAQDAGEFDEGIELNLDTLQAFLDHHFPQREKNIKHTREFFREAKEAKLSMKDIIHSYQKTRQHISSMEKSMRPSSGLYWSQIGILRLILDVSSEAYRNWRVRVYPDETQGSYWKEFLVQWMNIIDSNKNP